MTNRCGNCGHDQERHSKRQRNDRGHVYMVPGHCHEHACTCSGYRAHIPADLDPADAIRDKALELLGGLGYHLDSLSGHPPDIHDIGEAQRIRNELIALFKK